MQRRRHTYLKIVSVALLLAFMTSVTVPYWCSTGWCCGKLETAQTAKAEVPSCCAHEAPALSSKTAQQDGWCSETTHSNKAGDSGCATGCCKLAANVYVLTLVNSVELLSPVAMLNPQTALNTGIELTDYVPQPPRVLSA